MNKKLTFVALVGLVVAGTTGCMDIVGIDPDSQLGGICGEQPSVFAAEQYGANYLAVDATNLYWTNRWSGEVMKKPVDGGEAVVLYSKPKSQPRCIVVYGNSLYWTNVEDGTVMMGDIEGHPSIEIASGQNNPYDIVVNDQFVYWTNEGPEEHKTEPVGTVMRRKRDLSEDAEVFARDQTYPQAIAVDGTSIYWTDADKLNRSPLDESKPTTLDDLPTPPPNLDRKITQFSRIAVRESIVYWTDTDGNTVKKVGTTGGNWMQLAANTTTPFGIAVDETNVYWTNPSLDLSDPRLNAVWKVGIDEDNSTATKLADKQGFPVGIAVDKTCIYWANRDGNTVMMMAK